MHQHRSLGNDDRDHQVNVVVFERATQNSSPRRNEELEAFWGLHGNNIQTDIMYIYGYADHGVGKPQIQGKDQPSDPLHGDLQVARAKTQLVEYLEERMQSYKIVRRIQLTALFMAVSNLVIYAIAGSGTSGYEVSPANAIVSGIAGIFAVNLFFVALAARGILGILIQSPTTRTEP